ncbi:MAG: hypothetical protein UHD64_09355, partial [Bacteroidales bacterium]|nr:hypothetical protein [Bacteroidales bacterium]
IASDIWETLSEEIGKGTMARLIPIGEKDEARCLFDEILQYSNHLGLFSEDIDFETKEQLGNFPQAYSHLALVNTAVLFAEEDKRLIFK